MGDKVEIITGYFKIYNVKIATVVVDLNLNHLYFNILGFQ